MKNEGALAGVFSGMRNLSVRCVLPAGKLGPGCRLPTPGESCRRPCPRIRAAIGLHGGANGPSPSYRTRWEERALPIVRDEFRPAIPRRVARQQSPLPLHRHGQDKPLVASGQSKYHRTVDSVLTVCLTKRGNRKASSPTRRLQANHPWKGNLPKFRIVRHSTGHAAIDKTLRLLILAFGHFGAELSPGRGRMKRLRITRIAAGNGPLARFGRTDFEAIAHDNISDESQ